MSRIDRPEPRWQVIFALLAVAGIYLALPKELVVGPAWLLPVLVGALLTPAVWAPGAVVNSPTQVGGIVICTITPLALVAWVFLLVPTIRGGREPPLALLRSGGALWLTNVLVFA